MYTLYKFHFLNGISEINKNFDDILIIWPAPVYLYLYSILFKYIITVFLYFFKKTKTPTQPFWLVF